jgi:hypothetical protein
VLSAPDPHAFRIEDCLGAWMRCRIHQFSDNPLYNASLQSITKEGKETRTTQQNPLYQFMYALKSSEARRQYPKRLKMLFDYLKLSGPLEEQAKEFLNKTRQNGIQWAQDRIMIFLDSHKER